MHRKSCLGILLKLPTSKENTDSTEGTTLYKIFLFVAIIKQIIDYEPQVLFGNPNYIASKFNSTCPLIFHSKKPARLSIAKVSNAQNHLTIVFEKHNLYFRYQTFSL